MLKGRELSNQRFQIDALDGLRGLAVMMVFLSHTSNIGIYLIPFADFSGIGKGGVFLFFVLSSFLLTLPFVRKGKEALNMEFLKRYFFRRFIRIYPFYSLYLLAGLVTTFTLWKIFNLSQPVGIPFTLSFRDFIEHLLLLQGKGLTWSILVEFRYYFVLPILALTFSVLLKNRLMPSIALTVVLIGLCQRIWPASEAITNDPRLGPYLPIFFIGSLAAVIFHRWQESGLAQNKKLGLAIEILGFLGLGAIVLLTPSVVALLTGQAVEFNFYHRQFLLLAVLWSIVLLSCAVSTGILKRVFQFPFLRYLGFISFSIYLLHLQVILRMESLGIEFPLKGWVMLALTIGISHLTWTFIEKPASKLKLRKKAQPALKL